jgi:small-conductance mechanosensitive channel
MLAMSLHDPNALRPAMETDPSQTPISSIQTQQTTVAPNQSQSSEEIKDEPPSHSSPVPAPSAQQPPFTSEAIAALEAEERRIDVEMEEVRRMKELRDQKRTIQQKLGVAQGT